MNTKIYCDIADIKTIRKFSRKKIIKGFTTNPSLMRKAGARDYTSYSKNILSVCGNKPISFEVFADDYSSILRQALIINSWGKKCFCQSSCSINSKGKFMGKIIKELNKRNIKINITAVYTSAQTKKIIKLINKKTKVIISIFAGRAADTGKDPLPEIKRSILMAKNLKM